MDKSKTRNHCTDTTVSTVIVDNVLQDLGFQLPEPPESAKSYMKHEQELGQASTELEKCQSIQALLDKLGSDISLIKSQLEKKKTKTTLTVVNEKIDQILEYLQGSSDLSKLN